jgi:outer membrane lipase/esterase
MTGNWLRRTVLASACASAFVLSACGSSTVASAITPQRFVAFGSGLSDLGQNGSRYTVNDGSINIWTQELAKDYGGTLTTASVGGLSYATGNARIKVKPDAAGSSATPTITEQVDTFLAAGAPKDTDLLIMSGGISDVLANFAQVQAGTITQAQYIINLTQAGRDLATQVRRLVNAGGKYVLVTGTYDLGRSPLAVATGQADLLSRGSTALNEALLIAIADLGKNALYIDAAYYFNLLSNLPGSYGFTDGTTSVCTSVDAGNGIGTGVGQVSSAQCNVNTIKPGLDYSKYVYADAVYFTPQAQRLFGDYAYDRLRARF